MRNTPIWKSVAVGGALLLTLVASGCEIHQPEAARAPDVNVTTIEKPADTADVDVTTVNKTVELPDVNVSTETTEVNVPAVDVKTSGTGN